MINLRAKEVERASLLFQKRKDPEITEGDDMFFDAKEFHTSNKQIASILSVAGIDSAAPKQSTPSVNMENAKWGDDEDEIDIDDEILEAEAPETDQINTHGTQEGGDESSDIFVPPSHGADPLSVAVRKHPLIAALHVATGDF